MLGYDEVPCGQGGERAPAALGTAPVVLSDIVKPLAGGKAERATPLGYKTAVRAQPRILAKLAKSDSRLKAATILADAAERVGPVKGADLGGTDSKAGAADDGATTRVKHAARLNIVEALSNGWLRDAPVGSSTARRVFCCRCSGSVEIVRN